MAIDVWDFEEDINAGAARASQDRRDSAPPGNEMNPHVYQRPSDNAGQWMDSFNSKSQRDFNSGAENMVMNSIRDITNLNVNFAQNSILSQLKSGQGVITRPDVMENDAMTGGKTAAYLDRLFGGKDSISAADIQNNPEFAAVGEKLAVALNTSSSPSGFTWTRESEQPQDQVPITDNFSSPVTKDEEKPVKQPGEDDENFLERLAAWAKRFFGGDGQRGIPNFPGGGFPTFPLPGSGNPRGGGTPTPTPTPTPIPTPTPDPPPTAPVTPTPTPTPDPDPVGDGTGGGTTTGPIDNGTGGGTTTGPIDNGTGGGTGGGNPNDPIDRRDGPNDQRPNDGPVYIPQFPDLPSGGNRSGTQTGGGTTMPTDKTNPKDLQLAARNAAMNVYNDPANFDRFAPSPLQTMDSRYRGISSFLPSGEITPYGMNYQGLEGMQYANYGDGRPMQSSGPLTTYQRPSTGGGTTGGGTTMPPGDTDTGLPRDDIDSDVEIQSDDYYETINPKPVRSDFPPFSGRGQMASKKRYEKALEEWEQQKKDFDRSVSEVSGTGLGKLGIGGIGSLGSVAGFNEGGVVGLEAGGDPGLMSRLGTGIKNTFGFNEDGFDAQQLGSGLRGLGGAMLGDINAFENQSSKEQSLQSMSKQDLIDIILGKKNKPVTGPEPIGIKSQEEISSLPVFATQMADGGSTDFPRKNGQISGPGTERSDDIPAMLSDGEFVVNAKAVRGIGDMMGADDGKHDQRREGARAMYALQKMGEKAAGMS